MKKRAYVFLVSGLAGILSLGVFSEAFAQEGGATTFTLDVACNGNSIAPTPPFARGDVAVVNGHIYPEGTLPPNLPWGQPSSQVPGLSPPL